MNEETRSAGPDPSQQVLDGIESIKRHLRRLIVSVSLVVLFLILTVAAVFGNLVNYFERDPMMWGGATCGAAVLGFVLGWFARRKV